MRILHLIVVNGSAQHLEAVLPHVNPSSLEVEDQTQVPELTQQMFDAKNMLLGKQESFPVLVVLEFHHVPKAFG